MLATVVGVVLLNDRPNQKPYAAMASASIGLMMLFSLTDASPSSGHSSVF